MIVRIAQTGGADQELDQNPLRTEFQHKMGDEGRKRPTQKTGNDCWPHLISGLKMGHCSPGQSIGMRARRR